VEREQIASIVRKHLIEVVVDIKESDIDASRSMKEVGANSLDIVEIVSLTMRELGVKVPRSELNKLTNMNGLVDLLYRAIQEKKLKAAATT
jgi:acyl carrier protein